MFLYLIVKNNNIFFVSDSTNILPDTKQKFEHFVHIHVYIHMHCIKSY